MKGSGEAEKFKSNREFRRRQKWFEAHESKDWILWLVWKPFKWRCFTNFLDAIFHFSNRSSLSRTNFPHPLPEISILTFSNSSRINVLQISFLFSVPLVVSSLFLIPLSLMFFSFSFGFRCVLSNLFTSFCWLYSSSFSRESIHHMVWTIPSQSRGRKSSRRKGKVDFD